MKDICLTYFESNVRFSTYIMVFFRIIGVYVHERVLQSDTEWDLGEGFKTDNCIDVIILGEDIADIGQIVWHPKKDTIFLAPFPVKASALHGMGEDYIVRYSVSDKNVIVLRRLMSKLSEMYDNFAREKAALLTLADIYDEHYLMETLLETRFLRSDLSNLKELCSNYDIAIDEIIDVANRDEDFSESEFAQFAIVYLAYEYNYYCKRLNKAFLYDEDSIFEVLQELEEFGGERWGALELLAAQVYDDLLEDVANAVRYYAELAKECHYAFAWYKLGNIVKDKYSDIATALKYFNTAYSLKTGYYRALYKIGDCQFQLRDLIAAKKSFLRLIDMLSLKRQRKVLRPMEVDYLFKTYLYLGKIEYQQYGDIYEALHWYRSAERVWKEVQSEQGDELVVKMQCNENMMRMQFKHWLDSVDINSIYKQIYSLYALLDNQTEMDVYINKMEQYSF